MLDEKDNVTNSKGVTPIAIMKGNESYDSMQESFREVFKEINDLQDSPIIHLGERQFEIVH